MIRFSFVFAVISLIWSLASAQTTDAPLVFEIGQPAPLSGAKPADAARAGDTYLLPFAVQNRSSESVQFRRLTFRLPENLELIDPNLDGVDNDRDGTVDEGDEGFSITDGLTTAWRIDETAPSVLPGESIERAIKIKLSGDVRAGENLDLALSAAAAAGEATLRAERTVSFALDAPSLAITLNGTGRNQLLAPTDTPRLRVSMTFPSGRIEGFGLAVKGSPSVEGFEDASVIRGKAVSCKTEPALEVIARKLSAVLDDCIVISSAPLEERYIAINASLRLSDANPFSDPEEIAARRLVRLAATMTRDGGAFGQTASLPAQIGGPLPGARLLTVSDKPVGAGDTISASFRLVNRGDSAANNLRLFAENDGAVECRSLAVSGTLERRDGCRDGLALPKLEAGEARDITVSVRLLDDAELDRTTGMRLFMVAEGLGKTPLPAAGVRLRLPDPPFMSVEAPSEWTVKNEVITARIGDAGALSISGNLVQGRYTGALQLRSRVVDAQTGEPIAPAPLRIEEFAMLPTGDARFETADTVSTTTEDGWSVVALAFDQLVVAPESGKTSPDYIARATISLLDLPEIRSGRLIELAAQLQLFGGEDIRDEEWVEILIVEPSLGITVRSPDEDRTLDLHDTARIAVLSCNRGNSGAEALILTARLPETLLPENMESARVRTIQAERSNDSVALFAENVRAAGTAYFDDDTRILRGVMSDEVVLEPETCLALIFDVRRLDDAPADQTIATVAASVEPFTGRDGAQARIYSGIDTGQIVFDMPPMLFGPASERVPDGDELIVHSVSLEIPPNAGPHRVDLSTESSAGLDWTVLRLDESGAASAWRNGTMVAPGDIVQFRLEARSPEKRPIAWIDTTKVRAFAFSENGAPIAATTRLITRRGSAPGGRIDVSKTMALDRDCDGDLSDERIQDSLFEPVKDASVDDCVIFHVLFKHAGEKSMERIVVRDQVPAGTKLRPDAIEILRAPEPVQEAEFQAPDGESRDVVWIFEGLFEPGVEGEVSYAVKILEQP